MSEHDHQATVIEWANLQSRTVPELALLFAIPNGGGRGKPFITKKGVKLPPLNAVRLQKEGLKSGVPDLMLPVARNNYFGYFIEMKDGNRASSRLTVEQSKWHFDLRNQGYKVDICWSATEAIKGLSEYLNLRPWREYQRPTVRCAQSADEVAQSRKGERQVMMKYLWWFIGDPEAPSWVSLVLAIMWLMLIGYRAKKFGLSLDASTLIPFANAFYTNRNDHQSIFYRNEDFA